MLGLTLAPFAPTALSLLGASLAIAPRFRDHTPTSAFWVLWAGIAGGGIASVPLSAEYLGVGAGGYAMTALGGLAGAAIMTAALLGLQGPAMRRHSSPAASSGQSGDQPTVEDEAPRAQPPPPAARRLLAGLARPGRLGWALGATAAVAAVVLALASLGWLGVLLLLGLAAVGTTRLGWSMSAGFFVLAAVVSALQVIVGQLLLSPLEQVGRPVPVTAITAVVLLPLLAVAANGRALRRAVHSLTLLDASAVMLALTAGLVWWNTFRRLSSAKFVAQFATMGEDNLSHMVMLSATRTTHTALGSSAASRELADRFATYFAGSSTWQATVGGLIGSPSTQRTYLVSTAVLLGLLAGLAAAAGNRPRNRASGLAVLGVIAIGAIAIRASMAMYELGFPGQLMVACWLVAGLFLCLQEVHGLASWCVALALLAMSLASWWSWSGATPMLALAAGIVMLQEVARRRWLPERVLVRSVVGLGVLVLLGLLLKRHQVVAQLDALNIEGLVFRVIPFWLSFTLVLAIPLSWQMRRRRLPPAATALVLGLGAATVVLSMWQVFRIGHVTYYSYKFEYFLLALGWAGGSMAVVAVVDRIEVRSGWLLRGASIVLAVLVAWPLVAWTESNYRDWLTARGAIVPNPSIACAVLAAQRAPDNSLAIATGFGAPIANYIATRAMDVGIGGSVSSPFWLAIIYQPDPTTWPWTHTTRSIIIVPGPQSTTKTTAAIVASATAAGLHATKGPRC